MYESIVNNQFPAQKKSFAKKTKQWGKDCINAAESISLYSNPTIRQTYKNKLINYNLANDILDTKDVEQVCNPWGFSKNNSPAKMQNYPLSIPKIDLLVGEERKRRFNWMVKVVNDDAVSKKEFDKKIEWEEFIEELIKAESNLTDEQINKKVENFKKYMNYEWQDLRERSAVHTLNYLEKTLNLKEVFNRGFEDVLISSEEIFCAEVVAGSPILRRCNPLNVHTIRSGESPWVNDADIIVEDGYLSGGQIIDKYHEHLSDKEVEKLEVGELFNNDKNNFISIGRKEPDFKLDEMVFDAEKVAQIDGDISRQFGGAFDEEGNIRVLRVVWKSKRKVGRLSKLDPSGDTTEEIVDERYVKQDGDTIKWEWISEWWEGTRIGGAVNAGDDSGIYIDIKRREIQYRSIHNISKCHSGYIGLAYNTNISKAKSLMDRMKPYQYLYNVFMYRTELAFAKAKGRIGKLDLSKKPNNWDVETWLYYAEVNGWLIEDSFNEGNRGSATGKLAGQMSGSSTYIDLDLGNYIQQHINMLSFIENQIGQIAGVTRQREGQVENRETVRGIERAVSQSSHITEKWFQLHEQVKLECLNILLETAKYAWKGQKKKLSYVTDELGSVIFDIDGDELLETDFGLFVSNTPEDIELLQSLKELSQAGLQNDKLNFSQLMDIYMNPSLASIRRKIEVAEQEKDQKQQEQQQQAQEMQNQQIEAAQQAAQAEKEFEMDKLNLEYDRKERLRELELSFKVNNDLGNKYIDANSNGIRDDIELEKAQIVSDLKELEIKQQELLAVKKMQHEKSENEKDRKSKEKIAAAKPKNNN